MKAQPFSAQVFKTLADPFVGKLSLVKVMSGVLTSDTALYNANAGKDRKGRHHLLSARQEADCPPPRSSRATSARWPSCRSPSTGHTLCDQSKPIVFPSAQLPGSPASSMAVYAKKAGDEDKIFSGLNRLMEEDPTHRVWSRTPRRPKPCSSGLGEMHIDVTAKKLAGQVRRGVRAAVSRRFPIASPSASRSTFRASHKKQSGGHGQYGDVQHQVPSQRRSDRYRVPF